MKSLITTLSLMLVFTFGSCSGEAAMKPDAMLKTVSETFTKVTAKLGDVKDKATAETAEKAINPMLDTIKGMGSKLGMLKMGNVGEMLSKFKMGGVFDGIKTKIAGMVSGGNEFVKPLAGKVMGALTSFMGGK